MKRHTIWALPLLGLLAAGCNKEMFDHEVYKEVVTKKFPVDYIDEWQTWATMEKAEAHISVGGESGQRYKVGIYTKNPATVGSNVYLYTDTVTSGQQLHAAYSYPIGQSLLYVGIFDELGHRVVQPINTVNKQIELSFGGTEAQAGSDPQQPDYHHSQDDYLNPTTDIKGETANMQHISLEEMQQYAAVSDADLPQEGTLMSTASTGKGDGRHYRVAAGTELGKRFGMQAQSGAVNDAVLYIEGTARLNGNTLNNVTMVVANGGELAVEGSTTINGGRFVVLPGGSIKIANNATLSTSQGSLCYNAGDIAGGELSLNGSNLYNCGSINLTTLTNPPATGKPMIINYGTITAGGNRPSLGSAAMVNGGYWQFTGDAAIGQLTLLENSRMDVEGKARFGQNNNHLYNKSMLQANHLYVDNTCFFGSMRTSDFAIIKANRIYFVGKIYVNQDKNNEYTNTDRVWLAKHYTDRGCIYLDWNYAESYDQNGQLIIRDDARSMLSIVRASEYKYVSEASAPAFISIPAGATTGPGYNNDEAQQKKRLSKPTETPMGYKYLFEDNFPDFGDYDYNDAVITVHPELCGRTVRLTVSLDAVGTTKQIAAAIRLTGVKPTDLAAPVTAKGRDDINSGLPESYRVIKNDEPTIPDDMKSEGSKNCVVLNLFENAHWAMRKEQVNGMVNNIYINTTERNSQKLVGVNNEEPRTMVFELKLNNDEAAKRFTQDCLDVFILESYNGAFWEVHTLPWKTDEVLADYATGRKGLYNNNIPWALCVPANGFKYPLEGTSISEAFDGSHALANGNAFDAWATNHYNATNWYLYPTYGKVHE